VARGLIVDTGALIASERDDAALTDVIKTTMTWSSLQARSRSYARVSSSRPELTARRSAFLIRVLETRPVQPHHLATAEEHGRRLVHVHVHVHGSETKRGTHDLTSRLPPPHPDGSSTAGIATPASATSPASSASGMA